MGKAPAGSRGSGMGQQSPCCSRPLEGEAPSGAPIPSVLRLRPSPSYFPTETVRSSSQLPSEKRSREGCAGGRVAIYPHLIDKYPGWETWSHRVTQRRKGEDGASLLPVPMQQLLSKSSRRERPQPFPGVHKETLVECGGPRYTRAEFSICFWLQFHQPLLPKHLTEKGSQA